MIGHKNAESNLDFLLARLAEALESNNFWDIEAYAIKVQEHISLGRPINHFHKDELMSYISSIFENLKYQSDAQQQKNSYKDKLIEEIVNFSSKK